MLRPELMSQSASSRRDTGSRSGQSVTALRRNGNEKVFNLQGGIAAWRTENLPIVTSG